MVAFILLPENIAFSTALMLMLLVGLIEALGFGFAAEGGADFDASNAGDSLLAWLGLGRLPLLMLLVVALGAFALCGLGLQHVALAWTGSVLPAAWATGAASLATLPLTALLSRPLARILPADETSAVSLDSLIGRRGEIVVGLAEAGSPARARVRDAFGQSHYVLVEPHLPGDRLIEGDEILLVGRHGGQFRAISVAPHFPLNQGEAA